MWWWGRIVPSLGSLPRLLGPSSISHSTSRVRVCDFVTADVFRFGSMERSTIYMASAYFFQTMLGDAVVVSPLSFYHQSTANERDLDIPMLRRMANRMGRGGTHRALVWDGWYVVAFVNVVEYGN
jgi:hypothetical protein